MSEAFLSARQMAQIEAHLLEVYGITPLQTSEMAGFQVAQLAMQMLQEDMSEQSNSDLSDCSIVLLAAGGRASAAAFAATRHLLNRGSWLQILLADRPVHTVEAAQKQLGTLEKMGVAISWAEEGWELPPADLIIDALNSADLTRSIDDSSRKLIQLANSSMARILSVEAPAGIDLNHGVLGRFVIRASHTMTFIQPKKGFDRAPVQQILGDLHLADLGVPRQLFVELGLAIPPYLSTVL